MGRWERKEEGVFRGGVFPGNVKNLTLSFKCKIKKIKCKMPDLHKIQLNFTQMQKIINICSVHKIINICGVQLYIKKVRQ